MALSMLFLAAKSERSANIEREPIRVAGKCATKSATIAARRSSTIPIQREVSLEILCLPLGRDMDETHQGRKCSQ